MGMRNCRLFVVGLGFLLSTPGRAAPTSETASAGTPAPPAAALAPPPVPPGTPPPAPAPALRSADAILADSVKATGGDGPWKSHHSMETTTVIDYAKMAITGTRIQTVTSRNKSLAITNIPNVGEVKEGTNGRVVWSEDPVNGLRLLTGAEAAQFKLESTWNLERNIKKLFTKITVKADTDGGRALECLELTPPIRAAADDLLRRRDPSSGIAKRDGGDATGRRAVQPAHPELERERRDQAARAGGDDHRPD